MKSYLEFLEDAPAGTTTANVAIRPTLLFKGKMSCRCKAGKKCSGCLTKLDENVAAIYSAYKAYKLLKNIKTLAQDYDTKDNDDGSDE